ncbi:N-6 DNA methylase [Ruminococcaceae bacterium OttesenSCG-928-O06]|nr:N-6 DNA methylase [Ruminococcaceae bacterium OttesenSCG-928-O06]
MTDAAIKKRLGQYFSGKKVADLLVGLCSLTGREYVIDPMAGVGDMIVAAINAGVSTENASGIEIDPDAGEQCKTRIEPDNVYIGDAFSTEPYLALNRTAWDLVITNPPYVRYQSMSGFKKDGIRLKSAKETRQSLSRLVSKISHLDKDEKACFRRIIQTYSGLSDLAVPAWILCAALTQLDGRIAMVVPESWISRDYALSIKYLLLKFFDIEYIVEDLNSAWFPGVLVKTNLLVAKRVRYRKSLNEVENSGYKHIRLSANLIGNHSLIEKLTINEKKGYAALNNLLSTNQDISGDGFEIRNIRLDTFLLEMSTSQAYGNLLKKLEPHTKNEQKTSIPMELQEVISSSIVPTKLADLGAWGFQVGQGLRTGANKFFYTKLSKSVGDVDYLVTDKIFKGKTIPVAQKYSLPAFRYQNDAHGEITITKSMLSHRLLYVQEDFYDADGHLQNDKDAPLAKHIANAEKTPIESNGKLTRFQKLSAVKSNIRTTEAPDGLMRRWFMLPVLANRHTPELCVSRVNYKNARCCLIADEGIVVDANFSTLWTATRDKKQTYAMFALLNSTWAQSYMETIATIMGGGALKVEATHIRKLLLPLPTDELITTLSRLGKRLAEEPFLKSEKTLSEIDFTVAQSLLDDSDTNKICTALRAYLQSKINGRQR